MTSKTKEPGKIQKSEVACRLLVRLASDWHHFGSSRCFTGCVVEALRGLVGRLGTGLHVYGDPS